MGRYMKKIKADGEVAVMESTLGVRTRAKTLALQRLYSSAETGSGSYLQLRNRRLAKPTVVHGSPKRLRQALVSRENGIGEKPKLCFGSDGSVSLNNGDPIIDASFGENVLEVEGRDRGSSELSPCNLTGDPGDIRSPGSTTRSPGASRRVENSLCRDIPLACDLDQLFTAREKEQQKSFMDKYNFDPATDKPLLGRFEWEKVDRKK